MLIKNTDGSYCKIKEIKISGLKAYVTLVIYSSTPQISEDNKGNIHRVFSFYLRDINSTELYKLSHNNYWIDRNNNYDNNSNNIDINMHKEIILEIDITNNNKASMQENRWVRQCNIVLIDHTTAFTEAWVSEDLSLISKEIELPNISNIYITTNKTKNLITSFKYSYKTQEDFNHINKNLETKIIIKSIYSREILESYNLPHILLDSPQQGTINFTSTNSYDSPVIVEIYLLNLKGDILYQYITQFTPYHYKNNLTIKTSTPSSIKAITIKESELKNIINIKNK